MEPLFPGLPRRREGALLRRVRRSRQGTEKILAVTIMVAVAVRSEVYGLNPSLVCFRHLTPKKLPVVVRLSDECVCECVCVCVRVSACE